MVQINNVKYKNGWKMSNYLGSMWKISQQPHLQSPTEYPQEGGQAKLLWKLGPERWRHHEEGPASYRRLTGLPQETSLHGLQGRGDLERS